MALKKIGPQWDNPDKGFYNIQSYEDARGTNWLEYEDEDGFLVLLIYEGESGSWREPEPGEEPMDFISQPQEQPSPYDNIEDENLAKDHLPPPWIQGEENLGKDHLPPPPIAAKTQNPYAKDHLSGLGIEPPPSATPEDLAKQQAEERARAEEELGPQTPPSPTPEDLGLQEHYGKDHNIPDLVEEPAPAPRIQGEENLAKGHLPGLVEEEPPVGQQPPEEPPVQPNPPAEPPVEQSPTPNPPAVPGGEGEYAEQDVPPLQFGNTANFDNTPNFDNTNLGIPYQDYIPFWPMIQDPITGEWRNAEPGDIPGLGEGGAEDHLPPGTQTPESEPPLQPTPPGDDGGGIGIPYQDYIPFYPMVQDPTTGEWRNAEPGELEGSQSGDPNTPGSPQMLSNLLDPSAPGPTLDADLFNPSAPGPTLDSRLLLDPDSPGPNIDPALLDPLAPGPTLDPSLLDPNAPGPTVEPSLLDPSAPGESIDPSLLDPSASGPTLDLAQLEQGIGEPSGGGVAEPVGLTDHQGFTDPSLTELGHPEPTPPGHDFDDPSALG